jgi:pilus assembly protein CpaB
MNRNRLLLIGVLALAVGGFVSMIVYKAMKVKVAQVKEANTSVIVAAVDIPVGQKLTAKDLREIKLPGADLPAGYYTSSAEVEGRGVIQSIAKGEFILPSKLAAPNAGAGMPSLIPPGMRAVSVRVNEVVAVAGFVVPGTRVDVLVSGNPTDAKEPVITTLLENIEVLAAGQKLERNANGEPQTVPVITLLVSPEDAQKLTLASNEGHIQLSLRNPLDTNQEDVPLLKNAALYKGGALAPAPTPGRAKVRRGTPTVAPPSVYVVEMIRGDKRDVTKF